MSEMRAIPVGRAKHLPELRRPFTSAAVKFKPLTKPNQRGQSSAAFYIDARLAAERLNEVVGPENWSDDYTLIAEGGQTPALYYPIVCHLTVLGVTKCDVGQGASQTVDEKAWKSAYSDALKRAAVKFGVGAYLYAMPRLYAPVDVDERTGKARGFTKDGAALLKANYERWVKSPLNTFGEPFDHGDIADEEDEAATTTASDTAEVGRSQKVAETAASASDSAFVAPGGARSEAQAKMLHAVLPKLVKAGAISDAQFLLAASQAGANPESVNKAIDSLTKAAASDLISRLKKLEENLEAVAA